MSSTRSSEAPGTNEAAGGSSNQAPLEQLAQRLIDVGLDANTVREFIDMLKKCNVFTMGALRAFDSSLKDLVATIFEDTPIGTMQAQGFLATLRVRPCARARQPNA
tara:strand:+ start:431 stop:748 length:318 start_codon:yes stop_codon:yes gene_type:complete